MSDWKNVQYKDGKYRTSEGGGGGGSSTFAGLDDVSFNNIQNGQVPKYNSTTQKWENANESGGGGTVTDVEVDGVSVVNQQGVAEIEMPNVPVQDVQVDGASVVNAQGVAEITMPTPPTPDYPVTDVKVNGTSVVSNKQALITSYKEVTLAEYQALPSSKLSDGVMYCISDVGGADGFPPLIYSDEEREVGVWRDGKPLYQKTILLGILECDDSWHNVPHNIQNFERLVNANTIAGNILNEFYVAPTLRPTQTNGINIGADLTYIRYMNTWMSNGKDTYITIQYTKTTDTAGSGTWTPQGGYAHHYSTTGQIIGTWINGKPIYEIVLQADTKTNAYTTIDVSSLNIDIPLSADIFGRCTLNGTDFTLGSYFQDNNDGINIYLQSNKTTLVVRSKNSYPRGENMYVVLRYTKTTD